MKISLKKSIIQLTFITAKADWDEKVVINYIPADCFFHNLWPGYISWPACECNEQ